jgi:uncharacterized membrane protein YgaE (UPF0421/DUF939 family)
MDEARTDGDGPMTLRGALLQGTGAALVAMFAYATASLLPVQEPYWAPIAAVVVMYPDRAATRRAGLQRLAGTAIGSAVGWAAAAWWHQHLALFGVAVLVAVTVCNLLRLPDAARLCAVAVAVITLVPRTEPPHLIAFHRFIEVSYGVLCALAYTAAADRVATYANARRGR